MFFEEDNSFDHIKNQLELGYRIPGTEARENCAQYFIKEFKKLDPNFLSFLHNFTVESIECQNVLFKLNEKEDNIVILGAHYDTRKIAEKDSNPEKRDQPIPGANDGASGCAVLLELARILYHRREELNCEIWFLFFDAEDQGSGGMSGWDWCEGSQQFVEDIEIYYDNNSESFDCMILLDMVGGENLQFIWELYSNSLLMEDLFKIGRDLGYKYSFPEDPIRASITDDHKAFSEIGIPTADLIIKFWSQPDEWPYHHTHGDNLTHISKESLKITGTTVEQFLYNNYHPSYSLKYQGNYPWDKNQPSNPLFGIILLIVITGAITGICFIRSRLLHLTKGS